MKIYVTSSLRKRGKKRVQPNHDEGRFSIGSEDDTGRQINLADQITFFLILVSHRMPNQIRQLNFNDTFLDFEHLKSCFPQYTVKVRLCCLNCDSLFCHSAQRFIVKTKQNILALFYFQCSTDDPAERVPPFK